MVSKWAATSGAWPAPKYSPLPAGLYLIFGMMGISQETKSDSGLIYVFNCYSYMAVKVHIITPSLPLTRSYGDNFLSDL